MEVIAKIVSAAMVSVFVQNAIFDRAFGSNVGIYASRKNSTVIGFTLGITAMTTLASIVSFLVDQAMLPTEFGWLFMPLIYSAVISVLYILGLLGLWRVFPKNIQENTKVRPPCDIQLHRYRRAFPQLQLRQRHLVVHRIRFRHRHRVLPGMLPAEYRARKAGQRQDPAYIPRLPHHACIHRRDIAGVLRAGGLHR